MNDENFDIKDILLTPADDGDLMRGAVGSAVVYVRTGLTVRYRILVRNNGSRRVVGLILRQVMADWHNEAEAVIHNHHADIERAVVPGYERALVRPCPFARGRRRCRCGRMHRGAGKDVLVHWYGYYPTPNGGERRTSSRTRI